MSSGPLGPLVSPSSAAYETILYRYRIGHALR